MQLLRAAAVLTAVLPTLAIAAICSPTAGPVPDQVKANYENIETAFLDIARKSVKRVWGVQKLKYRENPYEQFGQPECKSSASNTGWNQ